MKMKVERNKILSTEILDLINKYKNESNDLAIAVIELQNEIIESKKIINSYKFAIQEMNELERSSLLSKFNYAYNCYKS